MLVGNFVGRSCFGPYTGWGHPADSAISPRTNNTRSALRQLSMLLQLQPSSGFRLLPWSMQNVEHQGIEQVATSLDNRLQSFRGAMQTVEQQTQAIREMVEAEARERTNILDQLRVFSAMKALQNNAEMKRVLAA